MANAPKAPKYRRQRRDGKADLGFVEVHGRRVYLGEHGTKESRSEYRGESAESISELL